MESISGITMTILRLQNHTRTVIRTNTDAGTPPAGCGRLFYPFFALGPRRTKKYADYCTNPQTIVKGPCAFNGESRDGSGCPVVRPWPKLQWGQPVCSNPRIWGDRTHYRSNYRVLAEGFRGRQSIHI